MAKISASKFKTTGTESGDFDGDAAGTVTGLSAVNMTQVRRGLSAKLTVDAETNTLTIAAKWQGSDDNSTWVDLANAPGNPAAVVLATGTAGADAAVTVSVEAPSSAYGYRWARCALTNGVATGTTSDTYSNQYKYVAA